MKPEVTAPGGLLTIEMAVGSTVLRTGASQRPQPTPVPPLCSAMVPDPRGQCSRRPSPKPPPSHCQPANGVNPGESKQPADLISSLGALRDCRIVPLKEETLVESSGRRGKVARTFSPCRLLGYKLCSLTGAEVSSCQPDFPLRTNVVRLQQSTINVV